MAGLNPADTHDRIRVHGRCPLPRQPSSSPMVTRKYLPRTRSGNTSNVGLGYLCLAIHMGTAGTVLILDEPTAGLHLADADWIIDLGSG